MKAMAEIIRFWQCESGATAVEYGLLVACISLVIIGAVTTFGIRIKENLYEKVVNNLNG